ncbi:MAG: DMT family transporter [Alphaproteobacteria bacterium]|nr:DMT family transporter [Alphaproteobacteria bacterium]
MSDPVKGALWFTAAGVSWAIMGGLVRYLSAELPIFQITFVRAALGLLVLVPWLIRWRLSPLPTRHRSFYTIRGLSEIAAMLCWFTAISLMPVADVVALGFTSPLLATLLGAIFLGERFRLRRGLAILIGMGGALLIVRPGFQELQLSAILAIGAAVATAISRVTARKLSHTENPMVIVASIALFTVPGTMGPGLMVWQTPSWTEIGWLVVMGSLGTAGHLFLSQALRYAEASELAAYDFAQLLAAVAFGIAVFGEAPDLWTWAGAIVIAGTAAYVVRREAQLRHGQVARNEIAKTDRPGTG